MRRFSGAGVLAIAVLVSVGTHARAVDQDAINRAIDRGVAALRKMQGPDGIWPYPNIGATALNGLALLECGVDPSDKAIQRAADAVRQAALTLDHSYSISLSILFLDRLGDPADVPLIESLTVRLLAGQTPTGGWTYTCPTSMLNNAELRRLKTAMQRHELVGRRELPTGTKRTVRDLPQEIRAQLIQIQVAAQRQPGPNATLNSMSDNSNTQFAVLALWVGRRQGLPVEMALLRVEARFRQTQNADGGWGYWPPPAATGTRGPNQVTTATMTCSGILGLAVADGSAIEVARERGGGRRLARNLNKDINLRAGLKTLATAVGTPVGEGRVPQVGGRAYYFLWSLERVAVALGLETIGEKDWYAWGAEVLLANQQADGSWQGAYANCGADTAFALLFLKRANLARDLTAQIKGVQDVTARELRAGGVGGAGLTGAKTALKPPFEAEGKTTGDNPDTTDRTSVKDRTGESPSPAQSTPSAQGDSESARLSDELVQASGDNRAAVLDRLRTSKGVVYTEALAAAIPQLDGASKDKAREALAERLTRMKAETLGRYLKDEDPEIRRAAAVACAMKGNKVHIPTLIWMLSDRNTEAARAAHAALKELSGEDFGPTAEADSAEREKAIAAWKAWWKKQSSE